MSAVGSAQRRPRVRNTKRIPSDVLALFYGVNLNVKDSDDDSTKTALPVVEKVIPPSPRPSTSHKSPSPMTTPVSRRSSRPGSSARAQSQAGSDITFNISKSMIGAFHDETGATMRTTASKLPTTQSYPASQDVDDDMEASKQSSINLDLSESMLGAFKDETIATNTTKSRASTESVKSRISEANAGLKSARESQGSVSFNLSQSMVGAFNDTVATRVTSKTDKSRRSEQILEDSEVEVDVIDEGERTITPDDISFDISKSMVACFDNTLASRKTNKSRRSSAATTKSATEAVIDEEEGSDELFSGEEGDSSTPKASPNTSRSVGTETVPVSNPLPSKLRLSTIHPSMPATGMASKSRLSTLPVRPAPLPSLNSSGPRSAKRNRSSMVPNSPGPRSSTSTPVSKRAPTHFSTPKSKNLNATISAETQTSFGEASEETQTSDVVATSPFLGEPMEIDPRTPTPPRIPRPRKSVGFRKDVQVSDNSREFIPLKDSTHRSDLNASPNVVPLPVQTTGLSLPSTITQSASTLSAASSGPLSAASVSSTGTTSSAFSFKVPQLPNQRTKLRMSTYMAPTHASEARRSTTSSNATNSPLCSKTVQPRRTISHVTTISSQNTAGYRKPLIDFADPKFAEMRKQDWQRTPPAKIPQSRLERMELQGGERLRFGDESDVQSSVASKSHGAGDTFDVSKSNKTNETYTVSEKGESSATMSMKSGEKTFTVLESSESASTRSSARLSSEESTDKTKSVIVLDDSDEEPTTPATRKPEDMETPKSHRKPMPLARRTIALTALDAYGTPSFGHPCSLAARLASTTLNDKDDLLVESSRRAKKLSSGESPALEIRNLDSDSDDKKKEDEDEVVDDSMEEESPKKSNQLPLVDSDDEEDEEAGKKTTTEPHGYYNVRPPSDNEDELSDEEEPPKKTTKPFNARPMSDDDFLDEEEEEEAPSTPKHRMIDLDSSIFSLGTPGREPAGSDNIYIEPMDFHDESANSEVENDDPRPSSSTPRRRRASFIDPDDLNKTNIFGDTMNDTIVTPNKLKTMRQKPKYVLAQPALSKAHTPDIEEAKLRRSRRTRVPRLNNFLGQRINYERGPDGLPMIAGITEVEVKDARAIKFMTADGTKITQKEHEAKRRVKKRKEFAKRQRELEAGGSDL